MGGGDQKSNTGKIPGDLLTFFYGFLALFGGQKKKKKKYFRIKVAKQKKIIPRKTNKS